MVIYILHQEEFQLVLPLNMYGSLVIQQKLLQVVIVLPTFMVGVIL